MLYVHVRVSNIQCSVHSLVCNFDMCGVHCVHIIMCGVCVCVCTGIAIYMCTFTRGPWTLTFVLFGAISLIRLVHNGNG